MGQTTITAGAGSPLVATRRDVAAPREPVASGMARGIDDGYARPDERLARLTAPA